MFRDIGTHFLRRSVAVSSEHTYASGFRSWSAFRRLIGADRYISGGDTDEEKLWALIDFAAWCSASEGNQAASISSKITAVQYFHRIDMGLELPTKSHVLRSALKGIARSHAEVGTKKRTRLPISWERILQGEKVVPKWGTGGHVMWLCLGFSYFFLLRSDEVFASDSGVVHPTHCVRRGDVTFFEHEHQVDFRRWRRANKVEVRFRGHKGDQLGEGSVIVRTREAVSGAYPGLRGGAGAVALMVELMSCHPSLPDNAPLSSYRGSGGVRTWGYGQAMRALRELVSETGGNPEEYALHSMRIGGATALAAGGSVSERVIQREGRWKSDAYKVYTRNNTEDSEKVSSKLAQAVGKRGRRPGRSVI